MRTSGRRISSFILLSVLLPMVFVAPFHHHEESEQEELHCESCLQHKPHPGHLTVKYSTDDCLVCKVIGQVFSPASAPLISDLSSELSADSRLYAEDLPVRSTSPSSPRAPPVTFCIPD